MPTFHHGDVARQHGDDARDIGVEQEAEERKHGKDAERKAFKPVVGGRAGAILGCGGIDCSFEQRRERKRRDERQC